MAAETGRVLLKTVGKKCPVRIPIEDQLTGFGHRPKNNTSMVLALDSSQQRTSGLGS